MTATPDLAILPLLALAGAAVWLTLACLPPPLSRRWQRRASWVLVLAGVPVLGWLTLEWGPGLGVLGFGLGLLMLLGRPTARRRAARLPTPAPMNTAEGQR